MDGTPPPTPRLPAQLARGAVSGVLLAVALHAGYVLGGSNFRTVLPGEVFRCAQPSGDAVERLVHRHGVRTVVNLRGCCPTAPWYQQEARAAARLGVSLEDVHLSATRMPSAVAVRHLLDVLDRSEYPIVLHCQQGADRTGLAAAMVRLLRTEATLPEARRELGLRTGHLPFGKPQRVDRFFDLYEAWLSEHDLAHTPGVFRDWIRRHYCPAEGRADLRVLEARPADDGHASMKLRFAEVRRVTLRCGNTSLRTWRFEPGPNAGIYARWTIFNHDDRLVHTERAGLFHASVEPGGHIDLKLALPGLPRGRYQLRVDLASDQHATFVQMGNDLLVVDLEVT